MFYNSTNFDGKLYNQVPEVLSSSDRFRPCSVVINDLFDTYSDMNSENLIYVARCEDSKWYVGYSSRLKDRIEAIKIDPPAFMRIHPFIEIVALIPYTELIRDRLIMNLERHYSEKYGFENVNRRIYKKSQKVLCKKPKLTKTYQLERNSFADFMRMS